MRAASLLILSTLAAHSLPAQSWPCVSRKSPDRSFVDVAETTGGQVILATPDEIEKTTFLHIQRPSHPETIYRSTGGLFNETREFAFPIDSTVSSLLISVMLACKGDIAALQPNPEVAPTESASLKGAYIARFTNPTPGPWRLRLRGNGFYSIVVEAKSPIVFQEGTLAGPATGPRYRLTGDEGQTLRRLDAPPTGTIADPPPRYRLAVEGNDPQGLPFQRLKRHMDIAPPATAPPAGAPAPRP